MIFGLFKTRSSFQGSFPANPAADEALKRASLLKKQGDIHSAVDEIKAFRKYAAQGNVNYTMRSFLRLPLYLQAAQRREEAWEEFYHLLENGYPNQAPDEANLWTERSEVYDKMRLFLQRDQQVQLSFYFHILSMAAAFRGRHLCAQVQSAWLEEIRAACGNREYLDALKAEKKRVRDELSDLKMSVAKSNLESVVAPLAEKSGYGKESRKIISLLRNFANSGFDFSEFQKALKSLLIDISPSL